MSDINFASKTKNNSSIFKRIFLFYYEGFRSMTIGKTLWIVILIKLFIFFIILKLLFFPNILNQQCDTDEEKAQYVRTELLKDRN